MTARAIAIASILACALLSDPAGLAAEGAVTEHALAAAVEQEVIASDLRIGGDDKQTRFVVDINRKIDLAAFTLADPYRVVVDLPQVNFKLPAKAGAQSRGLVKAFRYGLIMQGGSRRSTFCRPLENLTGPQTPTGSRIADSASRMSGEPA